MRAVVATFFFVLIFRTGMFVSVPALIFVLTGGLVIFTFVFVSIFLPILILISMFILIFRFMFIRKSVQGGGGVIAIYL